MAFQSPTDIHGTTRNIPYMDKGFDQPTLLSPREDIEQGMAEAQAHYEIMKKMQQDERLAYFKNQVKSQGDSGLTLEQEAAQFMNLVHRTPSKDPKAAAHGQSDRNPEAGSSDARLFFGRALKRSLLNSN